MSAQPSRWYRPEQVHQQEVDGENDQVRNQTNVDLQIGNISNYKKVRYFSSNIPEEATGKHKEDIPTQVFCTFHLKSIASDKEN